MVDFLGDYVDMYFGEVKNMSNDLISRKALMSHIENQYRQWGDNYDAEQILGDIEDFDTAYDVNKVVEQLEEHFNSTDDRNIRLAYHHAIEIVKAGGVNDKEYDQAAGN